MKNIILLTCLIIVLSGCATLDTLTTSAWKNRLINLSYDSSSKDVIEQLGRPEKEEAFCNVTRLTYEKSYERYWIYFKNDKLIKKSRLDNPYQDLNDYYDLGLLSRKEYEKQFAERRQRVMEDLPIIQAQQAQAMQMMGMALQNQPQISMQKTTTTRGTITSNRGDIYTYRERPIEY